MQMADYTELQVALSSQGQIPEQHHQRFDSVTQSIQNLTQQQGEQQKQLMQIFESMKEITTQLQRLSFSGAPMVTNQAAPLMAGSSPFVVSKPDKFDGSPNQSEFDTWEEMLSLQAMHGTTKGKDLFEQVVLAMNKFDLQFDKLSGLATDRAPAMVGMQKVLTALVKKEMSHLSLDPNELVVCHCIIHQESLCAHSLKLNNVMTTVVSTINFIKSRGLNSHQFKELLSALESEYRDLVYHCEVWWLSRADMFARFYNLREEVKQFMEMKSKPVTELSDSKWLCDLAFVVDITKYLSELNVKLQGPNQLFSSLFSNVKSFEAKLKLWQVQLERGNTVHFPTLQEQKPAVTSEYAGECAKLLQAFGERFQLMRSYEKDLNIFATPFNVEPADVPDNLQHKIIELQSNNELKARYNNLPLLEFYKLYMCPEDFPTLRRHALKFASLFGTTDCGEQFFSKLTLANNRFHSRLTDPNLENQLQVASSSVPSDIRCLAKEK
ncbi:general transcription factor II-I repeat domain-containing protein 2A-like [Neoarius graeffei]|uniref:general transcription factor II-I repeat domain-containing protein 2A-like n=1 Tax=Neoarius graeffei TaxID=443677 RepID=UPI00298CBC64|nr:general transcription factor II-I repeat domain-containing protein 2A-like [Neoarius graeffei]